jgi:GNAT superfamily N-acetyltransferase
MLPRPHRIRRGRRTDFVAVMEVLASSGLALPPADRATLRRFRHIVADLGSDLYVATVDEHLAGVVHASYARQVATYPLARVELLAVAPSARRRGIGTALVRHVEDRARQRACIRLSCDTRGVAAGSAEGIAALCSHLGWTVTPGTCSIDLALPPETAA